MEVPQGNLPGKDSSLERKRKHDSGHQEFRGWLYDDLVSGAVYDMNMFVSVTSPKHLLHHVTSPHL